MASSMPALDCGHLDDDPTVWHTATDLTVCSRCCPTCTHGRERVGMFLIIDDPAREATA